MPFDVVLVEAELLLTGADEGRGAGGTTVAAATDVSVA